MKGEMERRVIYGSAVFANNLKKAYRINEVLRPIGRPRKDPTKK